MSFHPDLSKQAQEVIFSTKLNKPCHSKIVFDSAPGVCADQQKLLGMYLDKVLGMLLDKTLNFSLHIKEKISKAIKGSCVIQNLSRTISLHSLIIYKPFIIQTMCDLICDQSSNESFTHKTEGAMLPLQLKEPSKEHLKRCCTVNQILKLLVFEYVLKFRHQFSGLAEYLFDLIPQSKHKYNTRLLEDIKYFTVGRML